VISNASDHWIILSIKSPLGLVTLGAHHFYVYCIVFIVCMHNLHE
jgi:hypothetical protein